MLYQTRIQTIPDNTIDLIYTHNQDNLIVITDIWELVVHRLKDFGGMKTSDNAINLKKHFWLKWKVVFAKTLHFQYDYLFLYTSDNNMKKIEKDLVLSFKKFPTTVMKLPKKWEKIVSVLAVSENDKIWVLSQQWYGLIFNQSDLRPMWKTAWGVKWIDLQDWDKPASMFLYKDQPFIFLYTSKTWKLVSIEDLRIWKRARKWDVWATGITKDVIKWGLSIEEWAVTLKYEDWEQKNIHSDDIYLWIPESWTKEISKNPIYQIFRPWEEKEENIKYKEEKKQTDKKSSSNSEESLF